MSYRTGGKCARLLRSFGYAAEGIRACVGRERNLRIHLTAAGYAFWLGWALKLDRMRFALLFLTVGAVISLELVNSAIESLVDLASPNPHPLAKAAKDMAAGAVAVSAFAAVLVGISLFWIPDRLAALGLRILTSPLYFVLTVASLLLSGWFIFSTPGK